MGNILSDIVEDIDVKPNKSKLILKWVLRIGGALISAAFIFGQVKMARLNRLDDMELEMQKQSKTLIEMQANFDATNARIDKIYSDGVIMFNDYQEYNRKQFELVIDYGQENKEMLKKMLEINALERKQNVAIQAEQAKNENPTVRRESDVTFTPIFDDPYVSYTQMIEVETSDTINYLTGATKKYIESLDTKIYRVGPMTENPDYPGRYDVAYRRK